MTLAELDKLLDGLARRCWESRGSFVVGEPEEWAYKELEDLGLTTTSLRRSLAREVVWRAMHLPGGTP
jgi:hypothetical protein